MATLAVLVAVAVPMLVELAVLLQMMTMTLPTFVDVAVGAGDGVDCEQSFFSMFFNCVNF